MSQQTELDKQLYKAAESGNLNGLINLIKEGANIDFADPSSSNNTPLIIASLRNHIHVIKILCEQKANVNAKNKYGNAALISCVKSDSIECCQELIRRGAEVNAKNGEGMTPLICAAYYGSIKICRELVKNGADLNAKDNQGKTAVMYAQEKRMSEVVDFLSNCNTVQIQEEKRNEPMAEHNNQDPSKEIVFLKNELTNATKQISDLCSQLDQKDTMINLLRQENSNIKVENLNSLANLANLSSQSSNLVSKVEDLERKLEGKTKEISDLRFQFNDLTNKSTDVEWLAQTVKAKNEELKTSAFSETNNDNLKDSFESVNEKSQAEVSLNCLSNSYNILAELNSKKIVMNRLLEELKSDIEKSSAHIKVYAEDCESNLQEQTRNCVYTENNLKKHFQKMDELFDELTKLQKQTRNLYEAKMNSKPKLLIAQKESQQSKFILVESEKALQKINDLETENLEFLRNWNQKLLEGSIELWTEDELKCLLEYINLDDWFEELKTQVFPNVKLNDIQPHHLMTARKTKEELSITWGEAKYFCLSIEQLKQKKELPKLMNDIDLNENNIEIWTIKNVASYFKNHNLFEVAKVLLDGKVNGFVLSRINTYEIQNLGIRNLKELNDFVELVKQIQPKHLQEQQQQQQSQQQYSQSNSSTSNLNPPTILICPLSNQIMIDPVIAQDGNTYERKSIEEWFKKGNNTSPITGEQIEIFLIPNNAVRTESEKWRRENSK